MIFRPGSLSRYGTIRSINDVLLLQAPTGILRERLPRANRLWHGLKLIRASETEDHDQDIS